MMQVAEPGHRYNTSTYSGVIHCLTTGGRFLGQCEMRSVLVVVADIFVHKEFQMAFVEDDHVVE